MPEHFKRKTAYSYLFGDNAEDEERERLIALQEAHDSTTERLLLQAGLKPESVCVEIGAGEGSVARFMARTVGRAGKVVALDINPRFKDVASLPQLQTRRADVVSDALESSTYDIIHARFVLLHTSDLFRALDNIAQAVKPGGMVLLEEPDFRTAFPATGDAALDASMATVNAATLALVRTKDPGFALHLPSVLSERGFADIGAEVYLPFQPGGSIIPRIMMKSAIHLRGALTATGIASDADIDGYLTATSDPQRWASYYATVSVWGRRQPA
jgi:SAM-dependent methyltransferase